MRVKWSYKRRAGKEARTMPPTHVVISKAEYDELLSRTNFISNRDLSEFKSLKKLFRTKGDAEK